MRLIGLINNKAQVTLEYALILAVVAAAVLTMQVYLRRGIHAAIKIAADEMGEQEGSVEDPEKGFLLGSTDHSVKAETQTINVLQGGSQSSNQDKTNTQSGGITYIMFERASGEGY